MDDRVANSNLPNWAEVVSAYVSVAAVLAVVFAAIQVMYLNRQIHRELESLYLQRYWDLMDRRSARFGLGGGPNRADKVVIHAYLQLSNDQLGLRSVGRVTNHTWSFWARDITSQCRMSAYADQLRLSALDDYPRVRALLLNGEAYDPLSRGSLWRVFHGL